MMVKPPSSSSSSSSSSKQGQICRVGVSMENHKKDNIPKQEPRLSGAYIRSLVKHLTTSIKSKDSSNGHHDNNLPESVNSNGGCVNDIHNNMHQQSPTPPAPAPAPPPERPHKKQVRRRQHATKPYQERLLNMAEARREIVTALKFHRASMKQRETTDNNHPQPDQSSMVNSTLSCSPKYWPISTTTPPPLPTLTHENLDFTLPNQTLGLNLNFQDFKNLDKNSYLNYNSTSSSASSSSSSSSSAVISLATEEITAEVPEEVVTTTTTSATTTSSSSVTGGLHHAMDEEEMEEIRSLGEQHQMEWDDTVNLLTSARWLKFLKPFEMEQEDWKFDQVMEFPDCMDTGEIEGMDGEWLA